MNFSEVKIWSFLSQKVDGKMILLGFHDISGLWKYGFVCSVNNDKNAFYFILKVLSVLEIFTFLSQFFTYAEKKAMIDFNIFDVTDWIKNNYNTHIGQYLKKKSNQTRKFGQLIEYNMRNIFLEKPYTK